MTWDDVVRAAGTLPEVNVGSAYGTPALRVGRKLLTRLRPEDDSLVLLDVPADEGETLIAAQPATFHTTPHYRGYPIVLARLSALDAATLMSFLTRRWRGIAPRRLVAASEAGRPAPRDR